MSMNTELGENYMQLALMSLCEPAPEYRRTIPFFPLLIGSPICISSEHKAKWLETTFAASLYWLWPGK